MKILQPNESFHRTFISANSLKEKWKSCSGSVTGWASWSVNCPMPDMVVPRVRKLKVLQAPWIEMSPLGLAYKHHVIATDRHLSPCSIIWFHFLLDHPITVHRAQKP